MSQSMFSPSYLIATCFGVGKIPMAPGTWGSLFALPFGWALLTYSSWHVMAALIVVLTWLGAWAVARHTEQSGKHDAGEVVIDELVGQWISLFPLYFMSFTAEKLPSIALCFLLFRLFDIVKPWPIGLLDQNIKSGWGVMIDDIAAGIMAAISLIIVDKVF